MAAMGFMFIGFLVATPFTWWAESTKTGNKFLEFVAHMMGEEL